MMMKLKSQLETAEYNMFRIPIPSQEAENIISTWGKRVICTVNGNTIHSAINKNKNIGYHIILGKKTKQKLNLELGESFELTLSKDDSDYQMDISVEFQEVLNTDPEGQILFEKLTPGKKRSLIYYVSSAKQSNTRINRAIKIMDNIKLGYKDLKEIMR